MPGTQVHTADDFLSASRSGRAADRIRLAEAIRSGLPLRLVERVAEAASLSLKDLVELRIIAARTLSHSRGAGRLSPTQSDRFTRFLRVYTHAAETFGGPDRARVWLERPTRALESRRPVDLLDTEEGARIVESLLNRIDHGLAA